MVLDSMKPYYPYPEVMPKLDDYAFLMPHIDKIETEQADYLGGLLYDVLCPLSVIDWGCASGLYLSPFASRGVTVMGIDAEPTGGGQLFPGDFYCMDIRRPIYTEHFELALCIEVGEHLHPEYADVLIENITRSVDTVFWSAARPGQGGQFHYNEQTISYWMRKFALHGFLLHPENERVLTAINRSGKCVRWLRRNSRLLGRV